MKRWWNGRFGETRMSQDEATRAIETFYTKRELVLRIM